MSGISPSEISETSSKTSGKQKFNDKMKKNLGFVSLSEIGFLKRTTFELKTNTIGKVIIDNSPGVVARSIFRGIDVGDRERVLE